ncbi:MAG: ADP-ribosylglycohydrolase family protein [Acidobacteria bacterium]|nr:ADP-ribosylglycohydrolase family protein [Acidobacteriota bacterium]
MNRFSAAFVLSIALCAAQPAKTRTISLSDLKDRIRGGWAGQMFGVSYGAPTEFRFNEKIIPVDKLPEWKPSKVDNALNQDDLYVDMTFAKVLDDKGLDATTDDFGAMFKNARYNLWHANLAARRALKRGVPATLSGTPKYNAHANDIDFQIEADFIGLMTPGLPQVANDIAWRAGRVMNYGDGINGGMFVGCMYAAAFFESDPHKVVEAGLACIPAKSPYGQLISDLMTWHKQNPNDWEKAWQLIEGKWNKREPCPEGALKPFNIDAKINGAYIALGLLYGDGDMTKTIQISTRAGQDSDCNPSSAAGVLGTMLGWNRIPDQWKSGIPPLANRKFQYTDFTFETIVDSTYNRALAVVKRAGGKVEGDKLTVPAQAAKAPKLEVWDDYGSPAERVAINDPRWQWSGQWAEESSRNTGSRVASEKGASAEIAFEGRGVILVGLYLPDGGLADVYMDGKLASTVDVYPDEEASKGGESVYHDFALKPGKHTLKLVVKGEPYQGSKGSKIALSNLVVFR